MLVFKSVRCCCDTIQNASNKKAMANKKDNRKNKWIKSYLQLEDLESLKKNKNEEFR